MSDEPGEGIEPQSTAPSWTETGVKAVLALIPYVGGAKNLAEVIRGRDFIRDKRIVAFQRED